MKALFYPEFKQLAVTGRPIPQVKEHEVLLKVLACGICGSELETFKNQSERRMPPLIMGHEFCGEIVEAGREVQEFEKGQRVVSNSIFSCGSCSSCKRGATNLCKHREVFGMHRNGAFGEFVNVPVQCLVPFPNHVFPGAASLAEPLANGIHIYHLTKYLMPEKVLIIGAGAIGLLTQQVFRSLSNAEIFMEDLRPERLGTARRLGAKQAVNPAACDLWNYISDATGGEGFDLVIDAVGSEITNQRALSVTRVGGATVLIGLHENSRSLLSYDIILNEKQVIGTYAATKNDIKESVDLIASGRVDVTSWIDYYSLDNGVSAFMNMLEGKGSHIKSVILYEETDMELVRSVNSDGIRVPINK